MVSMRAMECLVTIVEQGSLTQAAAMLHVSQPTAGPGPNLSSDSGLERSDMRAIHYRY